MKALIAAFALLSFVAATTLPWWPRRKPAADHPDQAPTDTAKPMAKKKTTHKKTSKKKTHHKKVAKTSKSKSTKKAPAAPAATDAPKG